jgi:large-conductance mechanosensitive channel
LAKKNYLVRHFPQDILMPRISYLLLLARFVFMTLQAREKRFRLATCSINLQFCHKISKLLNFSRLFFAIFSAVASPAQEWLRVRFSPPACDATVFQKIALPMQVKNRASIHAY